MCGSLGIETPQHNNTGGHATSQAVPNPSADQVKIYYTLPTGIDEGNITLYNTTGQSVKTYRVTNAFPFITLDNSNLSSGIYYYSLSGNGMAPTGNKMVVIK